MLMERKLRPSESPEKRKAYNTRYRSKPAKQELEKAYGKERSKRNKLTHLHT